VGTEDTDFLSTPSRGLITAQIYQERHEHSHVFASLSPSHGKKADVTGKANLSVSRLEQQSFRVRLWAERSVEENRRRTRPSCVPSQETPCEETSRLRFNVSSNFGRNRKKKWDNTRPRGKREGATWTLRFLCKAWHKLQASTLKSTHRRQTCLILGPFTGVLASSGWPFVFTDTFLVLFGRDDVNCAAVAALSELDRRVVGVVAIVTSDSNGSLDARAVSDSTDEFLRSSSSKACWTGAF